MLLRELLGVEGNDALNFTLNQWRECVLICTHSTTLQRELLEVEGNNDRERNVAINCPYLRSIQDAKKAVRFLFSAAVKSEARATDVTSEGAAGEERAGMLALQVERVTE